MRPAVLLLLFMVAAAPAAAQQARPAQSNPPSQPAQPGKASSQEEIMRQRILLRERFNKGWDIKPETPQERERRCSREAKRHYSALHPFKRRKFIKECIAGARR